MKWLKYNLSNKHFVSFNKTWHGILLNCLSNCKNENVT